MNSAESSLLTLLSPVSEMNRFHSRQWISGKELLLKNLKGPWVLEHWFVWNI